MIETFNAGLVSGADALSREYIENPVICQYIDNPDCTVIHFENLPYAETTSMKISKSYQKLIDEADQKIDESRIRYENAFLYNTYN